VNAIVEPFEHQEAGEPNAPAAEHNFGESSFASGSLNDCNRVLIETLAFIL
jgi:hypothetical protein